MPKPVNVIAQPRHTKLELNSVQIVTINVPLVLTYPPNVLHVLMKTELTLNFAHVMMVTLMTEPKNVNHVPNSVKPVLAQLNIVSFVLKDMLAHQLVNGFQSPNLLRLKTYQLDLPRSLTVPTDVKLVQQFQMTVYLVISTEVITHFAHVMPDTMKQKKLFVKNVVIDVLNVLHLLISVPNVME